MAWMRWAPYVPVARRRANATREMAKLRKRGTNIQPIQIDGWTIARSFWGKAWCDHLESFSDFANRLPRGRTYVRNGSVCHLDIQPGRIDAIVSGSELYKIHINIQKLKPAVWKSVKKECAGRIGSMLELLQGRLSDQVMAVVTNRKHGLFPQPGEIELKCSCPDWAVMCKHVAATLYGVGSRLDDRPELLFLLRNVDAEELISTEMAVPVGTAPAADTIAEERLSDVFGIELDDDGGEQPVPASRPRRRGRTNGRRAPIRLTEDRLAEPLREPAPGADASNGHKPGTTRGVRRTPAGRTKPTRGANPGRAPLARADAVAPTIRPTGKSVARLRTRLGLSVAEFARRLGVTPASVYRWEATRGRLTLQSRPLAALAKLQQHAGGKAPA
jgi:uncharacterized Zn finger protein/DNA-binding XRE family transcriptional regulator